MISTRPRTARPRRSAIRDACRSLGTVDLRGCELYTSCEPCALCVAAMQIAGIERLYYAAGLEEGANAALSGLPDAARLPIDSEWLRQECGRAVGERSMPSRQALADDALGVIAAWAEQARAAAEE